MPQEPANPHQLAFSFAPIVVPQGDGSFLVKPGKPQQMLLPKEAAARLRITIRHLYDLVDEGKIGAVNIGGCNNSERRYLRIPAAAFDLYLAANKI